MRLLRTVPRAQRSWSASVRQPARSRESRQEPSPSPQGLPEDWVYRARARPQSHLPVDGDPASRKAMAIRGEVDHDSAAGQNARLNMNITSLSSIEGRGVNPFRDDSTAPPHLVAPVLAGSHRRCHATVLRNPACSSPTHGKSAETSRQSRARTCQGHHPHG